MSKSTKGTIAAIAFVAPNENEFKALDSKTKIFKETFEEKSFYEEKEVATNPRKKEKLKEKADLPLVSTVKDDLSGAVSESSYIEIGEEKVSHIGFEDGSLYKIGSGFIKDASEENKKFMSEKVAVAKK